MPSSFNDVGVDIGVGDSNSASTGGLRMGTSAHWSSHHETLLIKWATHARAYECCYKHGAAYHDKRDDMYSVPSIAFGTLTFTSVFARAISNTSSAWSTMNIIEGVFVLISTVCSTLGRFKHHASTAAVLQNAASSLGSIVMDVEEQLSFPREQREMPDVFLSNIKKRFEPLRQLERYVPKHILDTQPALVTYDFSVDETPLPPPLSLPLPPLPPPAPVTDTVVATAAAENRDIYDLQDEFGLRMQERIQQSLRNSTRN